MNNQLLDNLEKDLKTLVQDNFHPRNQDLINMVFLEDLPELIKFARKVHKAIDIKHLDSTGGYDAGFLHGMLQIKREIESK